MTTIRWGDTAPNFTAQTTGGEIDFHECLGDGWGILFSHPADFTPVAKYKPDMKILENSVILISGPTHN